MSDRARSAAARIASAVNAKKRAFHCRGCDVGGDVIKLVEHLDACDFVAACTTLAGEPPPKPNGKDAAAGPRKVVAAEYPYEDEGGGLAFVVERIEWQNANGGFVFTKDGNKRKKTFRQKRPDPERTGEWLWNIDGVPVVPYRLPELIGAVADGRTILIVEGEAKADLLWSWNIPATCCAGGAKKWRAEHSDYLRGADVVLVPDNDDAGWAHVNEAGASLIGVAERVRVLVLPGLPLKGDIQEWVAVGGTREQFDALVEQRRIGSRRQTATDKSEDKAKAADRRTETNRRTRQTKCPRLRQASRRRRRMNWASVAAHWTAKSPLAAPNRPRRLDHRRSLVTG